MLLPVPLVPASSTATLLCCSCILHTTSLSCTAYDLLRSCSALQSVVFSAVSEESIPRILKGERSDAQHQFARVLLPPPLTPYSSTATLLRCSCILRSTCQGLRWEFSSVCAQSCTVLKLAAGSCLCHWFLLAALPSCYLSYWQSCQRAFACAISSS